MDIYPRNSESDKWTDPNSRKGASILYIYIYIYIKIQQCRMTNCVQGTARFSVMASATSIWVNLVELWQCMHKKGRYDSGASPRKQAVAHLRPLHWSGHLQQAIVRDGDDSRTLLFVLFCCHLLLCGSTCKEREKGRTCFRCTSI